MTAPSPSPAGRTRWTVLDVLRWTAGRLGELCKETPRLDAELMLAHVLGLDRVGLYVQFERPLEPGELASLRELVKRRQAGEPVAYLTGRKEFWRLDLRVDRRTLVPRPDTETLVEEAIARIEERPSGTAAPRIADVGTGSGALALSLASLFPGAAVFGSDTSTDALSVARENGERLGIAVTFLEGDLEAPIRPHGPFDLVVANLPYIPTADLADLPPEVKVEPRSALDGGKDGLDLVRRLVAAAPGLLGPSGALALEVGAGQADAVVELLAQAGLGDRRVRRDLAGVPRVVSGRVG